MQTPDFFYSSTRYFCRWLVNLLFLCCWIMQGTEWISVLWIRPHALASCAAYDHDDQFHLLLVKWLLFYNLWPPYAQFFHHSEKSLFLNIYRNRNPIYDIDRIDLIRAQIYWCVEQYAFSCLIYEDSVLVVESIL